MIKPECIKDQKAKKYNLNYNISTQGCKKMTKPKSQKNITTPKVSKGYQAQNEKEEAGLYKYFGTVGSYIFLHFGLYNIFVRFGSCNFGLYKLF